MKKLSLKLDHLKTLTPAQSEATRGGVDTKLNESSTDLTTATLKCASGG